MAQTLSGAVQSRIRAGQKRGHAELIPLLLVLGAESADLQALLMPEEGLEPPTRGL